MLSKNLRFPDQSLHLVTHTVTDDTKTDLLGVDRDLVFFHCFYFAQVIFETMCEKHCSLACNMLPCRKIDKGLTILDKNINRTFCIFYIKWCQRPRGHLNCTFWLEAGMQKNYKSRHFIAEKNAHFLGKFAKQ